MVTGAASGIGRALAVRLAQERMSVALCDVNARELEATAAAARTLADTAGCHVTTHVADVGDASQMEAFSRNVVAAHGRVTLLVNNAGVSLHGTFDEVPLDDIRWLMQVNFWGVIYGTKTFLPILRHESRAHIVNVSSVFGMIAPAGQIAYSASKFAVRGFTEALRHELDGSSVGVSCVHPGGIRTRIAMDGRMGSRTQGKREDFAAMFDRVAKHSPEFAAEKIVQGVKRDKARILIGSEAYAIDAVARLMPGSYWKLAKRRASRAAGGAKG